MGGCKMNEFIKESIISLDSQLAAIETCINRLTEKEVWYRFKDGTNSIGNLCLHLAGSEYAYIVSIVGENPVIRQRSKEFTDDKVADSQQLLQRLKEVRVQSKEIMNKMDYSDLMKEIQMPASKSTVPPEEGKTQSILSVMMYVVEHYAYHTGQIVYMTKLLQKRSEHILKWRH